MVRPYGSLPQPIFDTRRARAAALPKSNIGLNDDLISLRYDTKTLLALTDKLTGAFRSQRFYQALQIANAKAAQQVQLGMRDSVRQQVGTHGSYGPRPQRPGQRLERSIMSPRNFVANPNNFQVGIESWLNKSPAALYWRRIEEGDTRTFDAYILFSNQTATGPAKGPYSAPGDGGPHMRMKQFGMRGGRARGVFVRGIGPYPAFRYSQGGVTAFEAIDMGALYERYLQSYAGIRITKENRSEYYK